MSGRDRTLIEKGRRRPRASFERTLARIIQNIERTAVHVVKWKKDYGDRENTVAHVVVRRLWVVGSFARGAAKCGDLDVVVDIQVVDGREPRRISITSQVTGRFPDVAFYIGTPDENTAYVSFPEAVLLWSQDDPDWQTALSRIRVDDTARRFVRRYDELPLRREQFDYNGEFDELVDLTDKKIIEWDWTQLQDIDPTGFDANPAARAFAHEIALFRGQKTIDAFRWAVFHFHTLSPPWSWNYLFQSNTQITMGGAHIFTGTCPTLRLSYLESLSCSCISLIPHISRRGPNGIWSLTRGSEHPLEKTFQNVQCYIRDDGDGTPLYQLDSESGEYGIRLYGTTGQGNQPMIPIAGGRLLKLLSIVGWFSVGHTKYRPKRMRKEDEEAAKERIKRLYAG